MDMEFIVCVLVVVWDCIVEVYQEIMWMLI